MSLKLSAVSILLGGLGVTTAQAQETVVVFDCVEGLDLNFAPASLKDDDDFHQEIFQILNSEMRGGILRELFLPVAASHHDSQPFLADDLYGHSVTIVGRYGTFTAGVGFEENPDLVSSGFIIPVTLDAQNLEARANPIEWNLTVPFNDPGGPVIPAGAALHVGVIGDSFNFGSPDEALFGVFVSRTCSQSTSGTLEQVVGPIAGTYEFLDQVFGGVFAPGRVAMRVTVEPFGVEVPTVSNWGIAVMSFLLLTAGTLALGTRASFAA